MEENIMYNNFKNKKGDDIKKRFLNKLMFECIPFLCVFLFVGICLSFTYIAKISKKNALIIFFSVISIIILYLIILLFKKIVTYFISKYKAYKKYTYLLLDDNTLASSIINNAVEYIDFLYDIFSIQYTGIIKYYSLLNCDYDIYKKIYLQLFDLILKDYKNIKLTYENKEVRKKQANNYVKEICDLLDKYSYTNTYNGKFNIFNHLKHDLENKNIRRKDKKYERKYYV